MKTSKKLLAFLLSAALLVSTLIIPGMVVSADNAEIDVWDGKTASTTYDGGDGLTPGTAFQISNGAQLAGAIFNGGGNKYYKLTADIYLNDVTNPNWKDNTPNVWTTDTLFNGYIDGDNHIIYGLYYNAAAGIPAGLIPKNGTNTTISNLGLSEAYLVSNHFVGGFLGYSEGSANNSNCQVIFTNCFVDETCHIETTAKTGNAGGFIGAFVKKGTPKILIDTCYTTATVVGMDFPGAGFIGRSYGKDGGNNLDYQIKNSYTTVGQAVSHNKNGNYNRSTNAEPFVNVYATANVNTYVSHAWNVVSAAQMTGLSALDNMSALSKDTWTAVEGKTPVLTQFLDEVVEPEDPSEGEDGVWDGKTASTTYDGGSGDSANDPYLISTGAQLAGAIFNGGGNKYYKLTADIYLNDVTDPNWKDSTPNSWTTDALFNGYIDGDNHIIYGLYYNAADSKPAALIPQNGTNTTISNLGLSEAYVVSNHYVGGFLGYSAETNDNNNSQGNFTNCFIDETCYIATTHGTASVGGLIGFFGNKGTSKLVIDTCSVTATVAIDNESNTGAAGGLLGRGNNLDYQIKNSYTTSAQAVGNNRNGTRNPSKNANPFVNVYATAAAASYIQNTWNVVPAEQMIGVSAKGSMSDLDYTVWMPVKNRTPVLRSFADKLGVEEDIPVITEENGIWNGNVAAGFSVVEDDGTVLIQNAGELALAVSTSGAGKYYKLTKDIYLNDVSAENWTDTARAWNNYGTAFAGTIDGAGHIIYGLYISDSTDNCGGLLAKGSASGTHFKNIGIRKSVINGGKYTGAFISLAEKNNISFDQVFIDETVTITGTQYVSGFVGRVGNNGGDTQYTATFNNCYSTASVTGGSNWNSGITAGYSAAYQITNSYSFGYVSDTGLNDKYVSLTNPAYENCFARHKPSEKDANAGNTWTSLADWEMKGIDSIEKMAALIGDGSVWTAAKDSTPVLVQFADSLGAVTETVTITYKNWDGAVLKEATVFVGETAEAPETPSKEGNAQYSYAFNGWAQDGNTFTATFTETVNEYTITFIDEDGTVLKTDSVAYGSMPVAPEAPSKAADKANTYEFAGWDYEVVKVEGNATYTATYTATPIEYTVTFKNEDGSVFATQTYHYGDEIDAPAEVPTKAADNTYTYTFAGWGELGTVEDNAEFTATFNPVFIDYTVKFVDFDGTVLSEKTYHYGDTVEIPADPTRANEGSYAYTFAGWDAEVVAVAGDATYTATYDATLLYTAADIVALRLAILAREGGVDVNGDGVVNVLDLVAMTNMVA